MLAQEKESNRILSEWFFHGSEAFPFLAMIPGQKRRASDVEQEQRELLNEILSELTANRASIEEMALRFASVEQLHSNTIEVCKKMEKIPWTGL